MFDYYILLLVFNYYLLGIELPTENNNNNDNNVEIVIIILLQRCYPSYYTVSKSYFDDISFFI